MRRMMAVLFALMLCLGACVPGRAETQYPLSQGIVTDLAEVLGEDVTWDLKTLAQRMNDEGLGSIRVVTRHFLGGTDASVYAKALFDAWGLGDEDVLLLMVIGEESYAMEAGAAARAALSNDTRTSLLATHFRNAFLQRKYGEAVWDVSVQTCAALAKAAGVTVSVSGLFGASAVQNAPAKPQIGSSSGSVSQSVWDSMFSTQDYEDDSTWPLDARYSSRSGFNWRGWIIWGLVIYFVFFRRKRKYNFGHGPGKRR